MIGWRAREVAGFEERLDVVFAEADVPTDLLDRDAALGDDPANEPLRDVQAVGELGDVEQARRALVDERERARHRRPEVDPAHHRSTATKRRSLEARGEGLFPRGQRLRGANPSGRRISIQSSKAMGVVALSVA